MKSFDVVCPVFNEEVAVPLFFTRLKAVFEKLAGTYDCRLIFVDNCSTDRTHELVRGLCAEHKWVSLIVLSRNFGYQCSVECGLRHSDADVTGVVDVDCEDPPEMFPELLALLEKGHDVAYGERADRLEWGPLKLARKAFYRITRALADERILLDMAEFCAMARPVREAILNDNNSFPFIRASIGRVGFSAQGVPFKRQARVAGRTHYNLWRMTTFAIGGILSSSTLWLRMPAYVFPFWAAAMICLAFQPDGLKAMLALGLVFLGFAATGISIYLARVYHNVLHRPNFIVNARKSLLPAKRSA
jgi:polyisoprenyl-phosphate glycosyltransferase